LKQIEFVSTEFSRMEQLNTDIQLKINILFKEFNIYFNSKFINEINYLIDGYNDQDETYKVVNILDRRDP